MPNKSFIYFSLLIFSSCQFYDPMDVCVNEVTSVKTHLLDSNDLGDKIHYLAEVDKYEGLQAYRLERNSYTERDILHCHTFYKDIPMFEGPVRFHFYKGKVVQVEGLKRSFEIDIVPSISRLKAAEIVDQVVNSNRCYFTEMVIMDVRLYTSVETMFADRRLVWLVSEFKRSKYKIVDAQTGTLLN